MTTKETFEALRNICAMVEDCPKCPLFVDGECLLVNMPSTLTNEEIGIIEKAVESYEKANRVKTYKDVLLERFPNVLLDKGLPTFCTRTLFGGMEGFPCSGNHCRDCWNQPAPAEYQEDKP